MRAKSRSKAFTIAELALVVSGIGVLTTFVLPVVHQLEQRHRLTTCLGNLGRLGAASLAYATEDPHQQLVPMHAADVTALHGLGWDTSWGWRTALPQAFGGQTATRPFPVDGGEVTVLTDAYWEGQPNPWGAATRPLNPLVEASGGSLQSFHCPADTGYPEAAAGGDSDIPLAAARIPCFEMLGNSYRTNRCGMIYPATPSVMAGSMNVGPLGHAPEYILEPSRTVLYSDPLFYSWVRHISIEDPVDPSVGWHGMLMADNVAYTDGSARLTEIGALHQFTEQEQQEMFLCSDFSPSSFLRRGLSWQMDCYPAAGAFILTYTAPGPPSTSPSATPGWPYDRFTINDNPYGSVGDGGRKSDVAVPEFHKDGWITQ